MEKPKLPQKGGAQRAADFFKSTRKKPMSERLKKIISEIPEIEEDKPKRDRAAKDVEA
jgi:hypothetical protein